MLVSAAATDSALGAELRRQRVVFLAALAALAAVSGHRRSGPADATDDGALVLSGRSALYHVGVSHPLPGMSALPVEMDLLLASVANCYLVPSLAATTAALQDAGTDRPLQAARVARWVRDAPAMDLPRGTCNPL